VVVGSADRTPAGGGRLALLAVTTGGDGRVSVDVTDAVSTGPVAFVAAHPALPIVYAAGQGAGGGVVTGYAVSEEGRLRELSAGRAPGGPAHLAVSRDGRNLLTADYGTSSVTLYRLDPDGIIADSTEELRFEGSGPSPRQESSHPHQVLEVDGAFLVPDLGADVVRRIEVRAGGALRETDRYPLPAGSGPRHAIVSDGLLYVACELSGEIRWDALEHPDGFAHGIRSSFSDSGEVMPSAIRIREGAILVANRGPGTVLEAVSTPDGLVEPRESELGGTWPRDLVPDDDLLFVADNRADVLNILDAAEPHALRASHPVSGPTCVLVVEERPPRRA
jgi:6-phosphogluconolactonase (cycloisomerase 2 family)